MKQEKKFIGINILKSDKKKIDALIQKDGGKIYELIGKMIGSYEQTKTRGKK